MIVISVSAIMIGKSGSQGAIGLAGFLDGTALLDAVARRQFRDDGLQLLPHGGRTRPAAASPRQCRRAR